MIPKLKESKKNSPSRDYGPSPKGLEVETLRQDEASTLEFVGKASIITKDFELNNVNNVRWKVK